MANLRTHPDVADAAPAVGGREADMVVDTTRTVEHLVTIAGDDYHALGAPVVRTGRMPSRSGEIALDAGLAQNGDIGLGDQRFVCRHGGRARRRDRVRRRRDRL